MTGRRTAGIVAAAVGLAVGEFASAVSGVPSPVVSVGDLVVDVTPGPVVRRTIAWFGTAQKPLLLTGIVVVALLLGGSLGRRTSGAARAAFPVAGILGGLAVGRAGSPLGGPLVGVLAGAAGIVVLHLGRRLLPTPPGPEAAADAVDAPSVVEDPRVRTATRRGFLGYAAGMTVGWSTAGATDSATTSSSRPVGGPIRTGTGRFRPRRPPRDPSAHPTA